MGVRQNKHHTQGNEMTATNVTYIYNENCVMAGKAVTMKKLEEHGEDCWDWHAEDVSEENAARLENSKSAYERKIGRTIREML